MAARARATLAVCLTLILLFPSLSSGQSAYILGPEDVLEVTVARFADLARVVTVRPDGKISLPLIGTVHVGGLSVEQATGLLARAYAQYLRRPDVTIIVREFRKIRVSVLGKVVKPGTYALPPGSRLVDAIAAAGGPLEEASPEASLIRSGSETVDVDLELVLAGDPDANLVLKGGETLVVREDLTNLVYVLGEVHRPGRYRLRGQMRVLDALMVAGGLTEKASVNEARLTRASGEKVVLRLDELLMQQDVARNIRLQPGDTIVVPEDTKNKVYVLGDVVTPGAFVLKGQVSLLQALALAGGPVLRGSATARSIHIVRRGGGGEPILVSTVKVENLPNGSSLITADLTALLRGDPSRDILVRAGDVVVVPQTGLSSLQGWLGLLTGVIAVLK